MVWPILISLAVTPGASAAVAGSANAMSAAAANQALVACIVFLSLLSSCETDLARRTAARRAGKPHGRMADRARHAHGHEIHESDKEQAVDRPRRRLRDLVGDIGHELDEHRAEHRARYRGDAANDDADDKADRQEEVEAVRRDELRDE